MRIAHVLSSFELGGQERVALDLARAQVLAGHVVIAASLSPRDDGALRGAFEQAGVEVRRVGFRDGFDPAAILQLAWLLARASVDVVHTHNPRALVHGAPAAKLARGLVVHSKHGINPDPPRRRRVRRIAATLADAYVAVTPSLADVALEMHECNPDRLQVVPNGIDLARFSRDPEARRELREELGFPEEARVIGSVGRLAPEKNHALLLAATERIRSETVRVVLVGDGPLASELQGARFVHLVGARDDVPRWLSAFDVFALSSSSEGLPLALIEAMAAELPVVATRVGGVGDLVETGVNGYLVPPSDAGELGLALQRLVDEPERARAMGSRGRERVLARHSAERMADDYEEIYQALLVERRLHHAQVFGGGSA